MYKLPDGVTKLQIAIILLFLLVLICFCEETGIT